ncbi:MAG: metalloregulator ArsR/SmtB family transcription factor [Candidatus Eisenbacteria bacterium]
MAAGRRVTSLVHDLRKADLRSQILRALGNPARLRITAFLCAGERTVGEISESLDLPQSTVSQQLSSLRLHGLVRARREGGFRYYSIALPQVRDLMDCLSKCCRPGDDS